MSSSQDRWADLSRRGVVANAGAAVAGALLAAPSVSLAQPAKNAAAPSKRSRGVPPPGGSVGFTHKRAKTNGINLHYVTAGTGPVLLCMHGWPQSHAEFRPVIERLADRYAFIAPDLRGFADSDKPFDGYEPKTMPAGTLGLLAVEKVERFHILSHDLGDPASLALAYLASNRAYSLATIETPFFG